ncbi:MAG: family 43 glycosylhydrolase [Anaerolineae bacterium]
MPSPTLCNYAPPGEYIKDHTLTYHDGWWHLFSISGVAGYSHLYNGNEETVSWSISKNLVDWEFRGHILHASLRKGEFDEHEIWAPYCLQHDGRFYMFYAGIQHPSRPMCYDKLGTLNPHTDWSGHKETLGMARSHDLTTWEKISDREVGISIPGRDPHVVYDSQNARWLLYSTGGTENGQNEEYVSQSVDLANWEYLGVCARFPPFEDIPFSTTESMTVLKHPLNGKWIILGNWHYALSDDPLNFLESHVHRYFEGEANYSKRISQLGFACEVIQWEGKWYRSGVLGVMDYWVLGFHEIEWDYDGAFHVTEPSIVKWQF